MSAEVGDNLNGVVPRRSLVRIDAESELCFGALERARRRRQRPIPDRRELISRHVARKPVRVEVNHPTVTDRLAPNAYVDAFAADNAGAVCFVELEQEICRLPLEAATT